jgi:glycosyltransferase involved in cell wall biosynthesis
MTSRFRLAVVNSHPIQYFAPLYAYLNRNTDIEVTALYASDFSLRGAVDPGFQQAVTWDVDLLSGYPSVFMGKNVSKRTPGSFWSIVCPQVWAEVRSGKYDAVLIHGYAFAVNLIAALAAKSKGLPIFVRSETHLRLQRAGWKRWLRDVALSFFYRFVNGFFAIGTANRAYYRALGIPDEKIFDVPYTVDNDRFISAAALTPAERLEVRQLHGLPTTGLVVLYSSKFMRRKHPDDLVKAMATLQREGISATLFMVGTGEMETELRALVAEHKMTNVVFGGFINQAELPRVFAASDVFVLPAENEPWGLIVNEAMCAGLPVIVSEEVGCVQDLVENGVSGFHVVAGDVASLVEALRIALTDNDKRLSVGKAALETVRGWSYLQCGIGIRQALRGCVKTVNGVRGATAQ